TDACGRTINHSRLITVSPAAVAAFVAPLPGNVTVACGGAPAPTCLNYTNGGSGDCLIAGCVTSTRTTTPGLCGGVITETWTFVDECQRTISHFRVITVSPASVAAFVNPPGNITVACGGAPAPTCLNYTNERSGDCLIAGCVTSTRTATPGLCGGVITETWTFTDACGRTINHSRLITVSPAAVAAFVAPLPGNVTVACGGAPAPSCLNYTNERSGDCLIAGCVTSTRTTTPGLCGGVITETWTFVDACGRTINHSRLITVSPAAQAAFVNPPGNITAVVCGVEPRPTCLAYSNGGSGDCLIAGCVTSTITGQNPANCGVYTETWTFTDACGRTITHSRTITVPCCTACTYTQGAYGNPGGNGCVFPGPVTMSQNQIMINALTSEPGNAKTFGRQDLNRYWIVRLSDVNSGNNSNIFKMLPGGTSSKVFELDTYTGVPEFSNAPSWPVAPLKPNNPKQGQIQNQLFAQTLTLYFNLKNNVNLGGFVMGDTLVTADAVCGSNVPIPGTETKFGIPHSVAVYLAGGNGYPNTVGGLFTLANDMLGGVNTGLTLDNVKTAVDQINNGFDECRILVGYRPYAGTAPVNNSIATNGLAVSAFPNPYEQDNFNLRINAPVSGEATVQLFTIEGFKVSEVKTMIKNNQDHVVNMKVPAIYRTRLVYHVTIGSYTARGIVLSPN
ncbi:MAG TPA: hypothetical protein VMZ03_02270, partial [Chitinophagaceae bacterium]|nr:hypothetical protein [Chitinophagaceae bacterium]